MIKLLPCPFCGEKPQLKHHQHDDIEYSQVACRDYSCPANSLSSPPQSIEAAVRKWNTRITVNGGES